jgi:hypothetical protein
MAVDTISTVPQVSLGYQNDHRFRQPGAKNSAMQPLQH